MHILKLDDPVLIRPFLARDRFFADYALGDLDPEHFAWTEWFGAQEGGELCALMMLYHDLNPSICFALGEARGIELILDRAVRQPEIGLSIREEHLPVVEKFYRTEPVPMVKMALLPEDFTPAQDGLSIDKLTRLEALHLPLLQELYSYGGGDAFRPKSLQLGVFYGVFENERLTAVAGTHIVSDKERIAALGNVMTHPAYRSRGLATLATSAVCAELLARGVGMIGLSVGRDNWPAIHVYEKLGFRRRTSFYEGTAVRKDILKSEIQNQKWSQDDRRTSR